MNNLSIFIISQDYYELAKKTIRSNANLYRIFKPNSFRYVQNLYQDEASMDMIVDEVKYLTSTCWNEKYQPITTYLTKYKYTNCCRLALNSIFVPKSTQFHINLMSINPNVFEQDLINQRKLAEQQKNQQALRIKNRIIKRTHDKKLAESSSPITKKLDAVNEPNEKNRRNYKRIKFYK